MKTTYCDERHDVAGDRTVFAGDLRGFKRRTPAPKKPGATGRIGHLRGTAGDISLSLREKKKKEKSNPEPSRNIPANPRIPRNLPNVSSWPDDTVELEGITKP